MSDDDWVESAMENDDLVAELIVGFRRPSPPPRPPAKRWRESLTKSWPVHQRRSRTKTVACKSEAPRASPRTPLSWNGATSTSGGAGAIAVVPIADAVESGQTNPNRSDGSRSKVTPPSDHATTSKRPKKKKSLAALKEAEALMIEEQRSLREQLAALEERIENQKKENESLKKMKFDILEERPEVVGCGGTENPMVACVASNHYDVANEQKDNFVLPDLNDPIGEDVNTSY